MATIARNFFDGHRNIFLPAIGWAGPGENYVGYEFQLTTYVTAILYGLFGVHDWVARGTTISFGVFGIFAFHRLVRRIEGQDRAILASVLLAVAPGAVYVDRSFLPDPVMVSLVTASLWMLVAHLQDRRASYLVASVLLGTLGGLTKISGLIVGLAAVYAVWVLRPRVPGGDHRYVVSQATVGGLVLTSVGAYYVWAIHVSQAYPPYHVAASGNWLWDSSLREWLGQFYFLPKLVGISQWMWGLPLLGLAAVGVLSRNTESSLPWFFHLWMLGGAVIYVFGARELVDNPWNLHIVTPAVATLGARGAMPICRSLTSIDRRRWLSAAAIVLILGLHCLAFVKLRFMYTAWAESSRQMGLALASVTGPRDLVVALGHEVGNPTALLYSQRRGWTFPPAGRNSPWAEDIVDEEMAIRSFDELRAMNASRFGITAVQIEKLRENVPGFLRYLEGETTKVAQDPEWTIYKILK
jgi:4-amino-4-deoxy-L-arabinose transferase-like glycosyltransferase